MEGRDHSKNAASLKSLTSRGNFLSISMKKCVFLFIFFFAAILCCIAQESQDVVYLKNGNILKGVITELRLNDFLDIKTTDGRVRTIEMNTVERIEKEGVKSVTGTQSDQRQSTVQNQSNSASSQSNIVQDNRDVVYLKNGNIVKGVITELRLNDFLDIETDGKVRTIEMDVVERIEKGGTRAIVEAQSDQRQNTVQNQRNSTSSQSDRAQDYYDVVYLKNGNIVKGFFTELRLNEYLVIATTEGRVRTIEMSAVDRIEKEKIRAAAGAQSDQRQNTVQNQRNNASSQNNSPSSQNNSQYSQNNNRYSQNNQSASISGGNYGYDNHATSRNRIHFGVKTGLNLSNLANMDEGENLKFKAGFHGGVFGEFKFGWFAIQPELLFSMQGAKETETDDDFKSTTRLNMNYLNLPVMAKFYFAEGFCIEVGPQIGLLLSAKMKETLSEDGNSVSGSIDVKDELKNIDYAVSFGLSYQLPGIPLGIFSRSSLGLADVFSNSHSGDPITNLVFQVGAFVKF